MSERVEQPNVTPPSEKTPATPEALARAQRLSERLNAGALMRSSLGRVEGDQGPSPSVLKSRVQAQTLRFEKLSERLGGVSVWRVPSVGDSRGVFCESYSEAALLAHLPSGVRFVQDNIVLNPQAGVLRGLHWQCAPMAHGKWIVCLAGSMHDVWVNLDPNRGPLWAWDSVVLEPGMAVWIPEGFAHGYETLAPGTLVHYKVTAPWVPLLERSLYWADPALGIRWKTYAPEVSEKDQKAPSSADWLALIGEGLSA